MDELTKQLFKEFLIELWSIIWKAALGGSIAICSAYLLIILLLPYIEILIK